MVATLAGKTIVVVGGSSGIGYGVAKASLLSGAAHVIVVSHSQEKAARTVTRLQAEAAAEAAAAPPGTQLPVTGTVAGDALDAHDLASVRALCERVGEVDHFVWTAGDRLRLGFPMDLEANRGGLGHNTCISYRRLCRYFRREVLGCCPGGDGDQDSRGRVHHPDHR